MRLLKLILCCFMFICAGSRAWAGLTHDAVLAQVGGEGQLELPQGLPPVLEELVLSCLDKEPSNR
jgi:hypothetical protein